MSVKVVRAVLFAPMSVPLGRLILKITMPAIPVSALCAWIVLKHALEVGWNLILGFLNRYGIRMIRVVVRHLLPLVRRLLGFPYSAAVSYQNTKPVLVGTSPTSSGLAIRVEGRGLLHTKVAATLE